MLCWFVRSKWFNNFLGLLHILLLHLHLALQRGMAIVCESAHQQAQMTSPHCRRRWVCRRWVCPPPPPNLDDFLYLLLLQIAAHRVQYRATVYDAVITSVHATLEPSDDSVPFVFKRCQFPVKLLINLKDSHLHVGLDLWWPVFSHGRLYVALSQCNIEFLFPPTKTFNVLSLPRGS